MQPLKRQRLIFIILTLLCLGGAVFLIAQAMREHITFFYTPSDTPLPLNKHIRLGGLVKEGSVKRHAAHIQFTITDGAQDLSIIFKGLLPDLFREGQGVVAEGILTTHHLFEAEKILAKHDETYMPPEVADALKKKGLWRTPDGTAAPATGSRQ